MKKIKLILLFQYKFLTISLIVSIIIWFSIVSYYKVFLDIIFSKPQSSFTFSITFFLTHLAFHLLTYEFSQKKEYLFYANHGLNKLKLWISTIIMSLLLIILINCL
ncbi:hypothetical protein SAMN04487765_1271 [Tenacibaculum sp. MAR_2010_89]|nr:hypothetical protein SAMN04487765_1271 [Tenacibaculum sp. MAR_2010_89]